MESNPLPPLAERIRPKKLQDVVGQENLTEPGKPLDVWTRSGQFPSVIFWGPPGVGKTTLAQVLALEIGLPFVHLSAISAGVKEVREWIEKSKSQGRVVFFLDEIHRFNKSQQDALLGAVETGSITLIGATTENPSFEVNRALLSRCQVLVLREHTVDSLQILLDRALSEDKVLKSLPIQIKQKEALMLHSGGDARRMLNLLEMAVNAQVQSKKIEITNDLIESMIQNRSVAYDKSGEQHYDIISAFIKSLRGSDPNAAVYWMARMLTGGEDIQFIARRMLILAAEDIGLANPNALLLAQSCFQAISVIGMPEARIILSETAIYLATSPKSNSAYLAINQALEMVNRQPDLPVPLHLRNAPTKLMKQLDYGKNYRYAHDFEGNFIEQQFMPDQIQHEIIYQPANNPKEVQIRAWLKERWKQFFKY